MNPNLNPTLSPTLNETLPLPLPLAPIGRRRGFQTLLFALIAALGLSVFAPSASALTPDEMTGILAEIDRRQTNSGDWKGLAYVDQKEKGKADVVYEMVIYRRDVDDKMMLLFLKPRIEAGKGYLRIDDNLWLYAPTTGKWERRTQRERIGGTNSRGSDFDESRLAEEYTPAYEGEGKLGAYTVHKLKLTAKAGADVAWPVIQLWVDQKSGNILKRQEYALSGKLMRTSLFPKWRKVYSSSKKADVWYAKEMRFYDEVEKGNKTVVIMKKVDLSPLTPNLFTKAWLESKSR